MNMKNNDDLKCFENILKIPAKIYYHYTSLEALYSIIKTRSFRLMNLSSSNDKKELFYKIPSNVLSTFEGISFCSSYRSFI